MDQFDGADMFQTLVLGPGTQGHFTDDLSDVGEAGCFHFFSPGERGQDGGAHFLAHVEHEHTGLEVCRVRWQAVVVGAGFGNGAAELEEAAGFEVVEGLLDQSVPVADGQEQFAAVDEVEGIRFLGPIVFDVLDLEVAVWWDPSWLSGGDVGADHSGGGMCVGHVWTGWESAGDRDRTAFRPMEVVMPSILLGLMNLMDNDRG